MPLIIDLMVQPFEGARLGVLSDGNGELQYLGSSTVGEGLPR